MCVVLSDASILSEDLLLGAALRNLVGNAIKYTQPGGRVLIGCRHTRANIRIDVYDTGAGIPCEKISRIFEAFTRLDPARGEGLGIGLFIVRQALGILGHRIEVASTSVSRISLLHFGGARGQREPNHEQYRARQEEGVRLRGLCMFGIHSATTTGLDGVTSV